MKMKVPIVIDEGSNSKQKKKKKGCSKCTNSNKGYHSEKHCFKKKMDIMTQFLKRKNIDVPDSARKKELEKPTDLKEQCHDAHHQVN